jgi:hypothetical protein
MPAAKSTYARAPAEASGMPIASGDERERGDLREVEFRRPGAASRRS